MANDNYRLYGQGSMASLPSTIADKVANENWSSKFRGISIHAMPKTEAIHTVIREPVNLDQLDREVYLVNHCFADVELFIRKLQASVTLYKQKKAKLEKALQKQKKKKNLSVPKNALAVAMPRIEEYVECFKMIKLAFILLARLNGYIHNPNAVDSIHTLFQALFIVVNSIRNSRTKEPGLARNIASPLLTREAINLLETALDSSEKALWKELGDTWLISRDNWQGGFVPSYIPKFTDGFTPTFYEFDESIFTSVSTTSTHYRHGPQMNDTEIKYIPQNNKTLEQPYHSAPMYSRSAAPNPKGAQLTTLKEPTIQVENLSHKYQINPTLEETSRPEPTYFRAPLTSFNETQFSDENRPSIQAEHTSQQYRGNLTAEKASRDVPKNFAALVPNISEAQFSVQTRPTIQAEYTSHLNRNNLTSEETSRAEATYYGTSMPNFNASQFTVHKSPSIQAEFTSQPYRDYSVHQKAAPISAYSEREYFPPKQTRQHIQYENVFNRKMEPRMFIDAEIQEHNETRSSPWYERQKNLVQESYYAGHRLCQVTANKIALSPRELSVQNGELVAILDSSRSWWLVRNCMGEEGIVSRAVLKELSHSEVPFHEVIPSSYVPQYSQEATERF